MMQKTHISEMMTLVLSVCLSVFTAFASGVDDTLISFSTAGEEPDRYADGEAVMDGECYALVWSSDGEFEGLQANGNPIDGNDAVVLVAALAENGHCKKVVFQIDSVTAAKYASGKYDVLLLDTRVRNGNAVAPRGLTGGTLSVVNGFGSVTDGASIASTSHSSVEALLDGGIVANGLAAATEGVQQPRIKHIRIDGDNVFLTVENLPGFMRIQGGTTPSASDTTDSATATDGGDQDVVLVTKKTGSSGFFRVIRN